MVSQDPFALGHQTRQVFNTIDPGKCFFMTLFLNLSFHQVQPHFNCFLTELGKKLSQTLHPASVPCQRNLQPSKVRLKISEKSCSAVERNIWDLWSGVNCGNVLAHPNQTAVDSTLGLQESQPQMSFSFQSGPFGCVNSMLQCLSHCSAVEVVFFIYDLICH